MLLLGRGDLGRYYTQCLSRGQSVTTSGIVRRNRFTLQPTVDAARLRRGRDFWLVDSPTQSGVTASLSGTGLVGALTLSPSAVTFPNTPVGSTSNVTVTLTNSSSMAVSLGGWSINGNGFLLGSGGTCQPSMPASSSCTIVVAFSPTSAGTKTGTLIVTAGVSATLTGSTPPLTAIYRINAGSSTAVSPFAGDQYSSGGTQHSVTNTINVTGVTNAAPAAVYQSERYGNVTYTFPSLTASTAYTVRLHFAELYWTATGKRVFNVAINGTTVLSNLDIYASVGAQYKAYVRDFTTTSNSSGQIVVQFTTVTDNASISGIEILK